MPRTRLRFARDADVLRLHPDLRPMHKLAPSDPGPQPDDVQVPGWDPYHDQGMTDLDRSLRALRNTSDPFELGRLSLRSREHLTDVAGHFTAYWIYNAQDTEGGVDGYFFRRKREAEAKAREILAIEVQGLDYDDGNDGVTAGGDLQRAMVARVRRG